MLSLPDDRLRAREDLLKKLRGRDPTLEECRRLLEIDPDDHVILNFAAMLELRAGNKAAAEPLFRRSMRSAPWDWKAYFSFAFNGDELSVDLHTGYSGLAFLKLLLDEDIVQQVENNPPDWFKTTERLAPHLSGGARLEALGHAFHELSDRNHEVRELLRPEWLLVSIQFGDELDRETVDEVIERGDAMIPLLVGYLRGWARGFLSEDDDVRAENAAALLGEVGGAAEIEPLLELAVDNQGPVNGAAVWGIGRICQRHPASSERLLAERAPAMSGDERAMVIGALQESARRIPPMLLHALCEGVERFSKEKLDVFFPLLITTLALDGPENLAKAKGLLRRHTRKLSSRARQVCGLILEEAEAGHMTAKPPEPQPSVYEICGDGVDWEDDDDADDDEDEIRYGEDGKDDQHSYIAPVQRHHQLGRNDPCWCGSGKKYKKCHLEDDERETGGPTRLLDRFDRVRRRIGEFLWETVKKNDKEDPVRPFRIPGDAEPDPIALADWLVHDWVIPQRGTFVMTEFLRRYGSQLSSVERDAVVSWSKSYVGLYEVRELEPGRGVLLEDLLEGGTEFVHDVSSSNTLSRWDVLLTRVVNGSRGRELTGHALSVQRTHLDALLEWMKEDRDKTDASWPEYMKGNYPRVRRQAFAIAREWLSNVRLSNTDGEELLISRAVYDVRDPDALRAALDAAAELHSDEPDRYCWSSRGAQEGSTLLATLKIEGARFTVECNSRERHERARKLIRRIAGVHLRHARDEFTTMNELKRGAVSRPSRADPRSEIPADVANEVIGEYLERHYKDWPDRSLPALGGKTPRRAVETPEGRERVESILKQIENGEEQRRRAGRAWYDVVNLRRELGLPV